MASRKKVFKGTAITNFQKGKNKPEKYNAGDSFSTKSELLYNSLVNLKKIK